MTIQKNKDFKTYLSLLAAQSLLSARYKDEHAYASVLDVPELYGQDAQYKITRTEEFDSRETTMDWFQNANKKLKELGANNKDAIKDYDYEVEFKYDMSAFNLGVPLSKLIQLKEVFGASEIYCSGTGNDYELSEVTSGHDDEIIIRVELKGNKENLITGYDKWLVDIDLKNQEAKKLKIK